LRLRLLMVWFDVVRMTEQPPNRMSQSPERGHRHSLRNSEATNGRLAGAAAMLTHGIAARTGRTSRHHWQSGLLSRQARRDLRTGRPPCASPCYSPAVKGLPSFSCANHALQRTPGFGVQLPGAALIRPAQSRAVLPAMKPGTARAFASRRRAHTRVPGPESLSLGSLGVATFIL